MKVTVWAGLLATGSLIAWPSSAPAVRASHCGSNSSNESKEALSWGRYVTSATIPNIAAIRDTLKIPAVDSSLVVLVQSDSVCQIAATLISRDFGRPDTISRTVHLVSFAGRRYYALIDGNDMPGFVMDSTLTTILERLQR